ncbi:MAG: hypothetical protein DYG89_15235 [Caldilinea sp. CFX5]|nr:hypothetical protein [Caldilinea sp. CFX5]
MAKMKVGQLVKDVRTVVIDVEGEPLGVTYRPSEITPATEAAMMDQVDGSRAGGGLCKLLTKVLIGWELVGDDEKPYPTTEAALRKLPIAFLGVVVKGITDDLRPNGTSAAALNDGSVAAG